MFTANNESRKNFNNATATPRIYNVSAYHFFNTYQKTTIKLIDATSKEGFSSLRFIRRTDISKELFNAWFANRIFTVKYGCTPIIDSNGNFDQSVLTR